MKISMVRMVRLFLLLSICVVAQLDKIQHAHYIILETRTEWHSLRFPIYFYFTFWIRTMVSVHTHTHTQHNRKQKGKVNNVCLCSHLFTARVTHSTLLFFLAESGVLMLCGVVMRCADLVIITFSFRLMLSSQHCEYHYAFHVCAYASFSHLTTIFYANSQNKLSLNK